MHELILNDDEPISVRVNGSAIAVWSCLLPHAKSPHTEASNLGRYFMCDHQSNTIVRHYLDLESFARERVVGGLGMCGGLRGRTHEQSQI